MAGLPSLYMCLRYPVFFNRIDATCYFNYPGSVPHYPLFYPFYCSTIAKIFGDSMTTMYALIVGQHIFYIMAIVYVATYFESLYSRMVFLTCMFFAFTAVVYVHGVYTEAWAIIAIAFMTGALLRICSSGSKSGRLHYFIYTGAMALLLLTRFAGVFLIFTLPLVVVLKGAWSKSIFKRGPLISLLKQSALPLICLVIVQAITGIVVKQHYGRNFSVYGQPGTYRINDALNPVYAHRNPDEVMACYKSKTTDTLVKIAFDVIRVNTYNELWMGAYRPLDSVRTAFIRNGICNSVQSTDDYLNAAYRIYISTPSCYPYKAIFSGFYDLLFNPVCITEVVHDTRSFVQRDYLSLPASFSALKKEVPIEATLSSYNNADTDPLFFFSQYFLIPPLLIAGLLFLKWRFKITGWLMVLSGAITMSMLASHFISSVITAHESRYGQPAELMMYLVVSVVIAETVRVKQVLPDNSKTGIDGSR